ncbi:hypothetical protein ACFWNW_07960 [Streptomyces seoulensis]|uniref:hypothetical protein n=1 Tax=Streptomyces seoulensis TaxID=73044 RepID=UPI0036606BB8
MSLYSSIDVAATVTSIPFAVVGFGVTIWQSRQAKNAAEAARDAAREATDNISRASLLVLIPQMHRVEEELERAVRDKSVDLALSWLSTWRWQAGQARGFLSSSTADEVEVLSALQASVTAARSSKAKLIDSQGVDIVAATKQALSAIGKVTGELGALAASYGIQMGGGSGE